MESMALATHFALVHGPHCCISVHGCMLCSTQPPPPCSYRLLVYPPQARCCHVLAGGAWGHNARDLTQWAPSPGLTIHSSAHTHSCKPRVPPLADTHSVHVQSKRTRAEPLLEATLHSPQIPNRTITLMLVHGVAPCSTDARVKELWRCVPYSYLACVLCKGHVPMHTAR